MNKKTRKAYHINKHEEYLKLFADDKASANERMRARALKEAQEVRRFEIQLYWHRTAFFWAFITIIYTALFSVLCKYMDSSCKYSFFVPVISTLSGLGCFFSIAWHMVNKGSKFWQKNWETHVSLLEETEIGPLYDVYLNPKGTSIYNGEVATGKYYNGNNLSGVNKKYATDKNWSNAVYTWIEYLYNRL